MGVPNNLAARKSLRSSVVGGISVGEGSRDDVGHLDGDVECSIRLNAAAP